MHCYCYCHVSPYPAEMTNVVDALTACPACREAHAPLKVAPRMVRRDKMRVMTHDGRNISWEEYNREMQNRADSWKNQGDGENCA